MWFEIFYYFAFKHMSQHSTAQIKHLKGPKKNKLETAIKKNDFDVIDQLNELSETLSECKACLEILVEARKKAAAMSVKPHQNYREAGRDISKGIIDRKRAGKGL